MNRVEMFLPTDGCRYDCYVKDKTNRAYCKRFDKDCRPSPLIETKGHEKQRDAYVAGLPELLRAGYNVLRAQVTSGKKDFAPLLKFYNYVRPTAFVYGSPRPVPMGVKDIAAIIPIESVSEGWDWWDILVTTKKLKPSVLDEYEFTPLTPAAKFFFKVSNLTRYGILSAKEIKQYKAWYKDMQFSYKMAAQDFMTMGKEYFEKRYKSKGRYAMTYESAEDLLKQIGIKERE